MSTSRDDVGAAFDRLMGGENESAEPAEETPEVPEPVEAAPEEPAEELAEESEPHQEETQEEKAQRARDEAGRFAKAPKAAPAEAPAAAKPPPAAKPGTAAVPPAGQPQAPAAPAPKPPASWKPQEREHWGKLPPEVQQAVSRREREAAVALQQAAEKSKGFEAFASVAAPFENHFRARGTNSVAMAQSLFQTAYKLETGTPVERAQLLASMVQNVLPGREGLELLDQVLSGQSPRAGQGPQQQQLNPEALAHQVRQQVLQHLQTQQQQVLAEQGRQSVAAFEASQPEFYEDVRPLMAAMMRTYADQGLELTIQQAYDAACRAHPDVSVQLQQRQQTQANTRRVSTQRARAAASSVRSEPGGPLKPTRNGTDTEADVAAIFERLQGGG